MRIALARVITPSHPPTPSFPEPPSSASDHSRAIPYVPDLRCTAGCAELDHLQAQFDEQQRTVSELKYNNSMLTALNTALGIECRLRQQSCAAAYAQTANALHLRILLPGANPRICPYSVCAHAEIWRNTPVPITNESDQCLHRMVRGRQWHVRRQQRQRLHRCSSFPAHPPPLGASDLPNRAADPAFRTCQPHHGSLTRASCCR